MKLRQTIIVMGVDLSIAVVYSDNLNVNAPAADGSRTGDYQLVFGIGKSIAIGE